MKLPSCFLVDVGKGNCTVICDTEGVVVVDTGLRQRLLSFLIEQEIRSIDSLIISHADQDHMVGIIDILMSDEIEVKSVYLNADPSQNSKQWSGIARALSDAINRKGTRVVGSVSTGLTDLINHGQLTIEILAPDVEEGLLGIGGRDAEGRVIDRHSLNAVVRVSKDEQRRILLLGDLNQRGFDNLQGKNVDLQAELMVFPHHGGAPGSRDPSAFAISLCDSVQPRYVVFSVACNERHHPRVDIVEAIAQRDDCLILSTGTSSPLEEYIERNPECKHQNKIGHIRLSLYEDPVTPVAM